jgi:formate hydrogenlyase transcriptional activator
MLDRRTVDVLQSYSWPGNVRELQNVIERSVIVCQTDTFRVDARWLSRKAADAPPPAQSLGLELVTRERELIEAALADARGRVSGQSGAAARLGIPASTLESKIKALGINKERFKGS